VTEAGRYSAILFDAGNTLVHLDARRLRDVLRPAGASTEVEEIRRSELEARRLLHEALGAGHVGTEPEVWHGYFMELFRRAGVPEDRLSEAGRLLERAHAESHLWTWVEEGTAWALDRLREAGYRLAVISNADGRVEGLLQEVGLAARFEFVVDSEVVGFEKPDRRIFDYAVTRLGVPADACLYVGDLLTVDYRGATRAGMACVLVDPLGLHASRAPTISTLAALPQFLGIPASS